MFGASFWPWLPQRACCRGGVRWIEAAVDAVRLLSQRGGSKQARRSKRLCPALGIGGKSATRSVAKRGAPDAQRRNLGVADFLPLIPSSGQGRFALQACWGPQRLPEG
eukprot:9453794-Alexandrium_andersonii.AAC.1